MLVKTPLPDSSQNIRELIEEVRKCLGGTGWIHDDYARRLQAGQGERHRHPVIVVGMYLRGYRGAGVNCYAVGELFHGYSHTPEFRCHCSDPVRLLPADVLDIPDCYRRIGE